MKKLNDKVNSWVNFAVLFLLTMNYLLYSFFEQGQLRNYVRLLVAAMLALTLILQLLKNSLRRRHVALLLIAVYQILAGGTNSLNISFLILVVLMMSECEKKLVFKQAFFILAAFTVVVALCLAFGIQKNWNYSIDGRERNTLGFVNVNGAGIFAFSLGATYLLSLRKVKLLHLGIVAAVAVALFCITDSRTPFLGILIMIALWLIVPVIPKKWAKRCLWVGIVLLFLTPAIWSLPFVNSQQGNLVLSLRPSYFAAYIEKQSVVTFLFGGSRAAEIDNGYLLLLYNCGVVVYLAIGLAVIKAAEKLLEKESYMELAFLGTMLVCAVLEGSIVRPELLCAPLLWGVIFDNISWGQGESFLVSKTRKLLGRFLPLSQGETDR